ncbi:MAG: DNA polymerase/3'-5' exonuclease PolX [Planctomycetes bacterium]|nr:DNA polymerase/3'-5' exonuclease PolX [Planctomycetota bacterium]
MEIAGENAFKIRALRNAAQTIEGLTERLESMAEAGALQSIPGVGEGIATRIREILRTGSTHDVAAVAPSVPRGLLEVMRVEGVGPKTAKKLHDELGVTDLASLEAAARAGKVRGLDRMGEKKEEKILKGIEAFRTRSGRYPAYQAYPYAITALERLRAVRGVARAEFAGSLRRCAETVGDLDVLVAAPDAIAPAVMAALVEWDSVSEVIARGDTKTSVHLRNGIQMDLRVVPEESFGAALHYFTGSKTHNVAIRDRAKRMGLKVSEWGVFRVTKSGEEERISGAEEADVFREVGLPWIPPELRENRGEIEAAEKGALPTLVDLGDVRGDVHMHTRETDGAATIEEMAAAGRERGYRYVAITDHSQSLTVARGMDATRLRAQMAAIDAANATSHGIRIFKGIEVDVLGDGALDMDSDVLADLDVVIASVHSKMSQPREEMTHRVVRAIESGLVDVVGHPTGRIIGRRSAFEVDVERMIKAAASHGVAMEINAYPDRLDLSDVHAHMAKEMGVKIVISTDSHSPRHLDLVRWGVSTARRGWLEKQDVLNTIAEPAAFLKALHGPRKRGR